MTKHIFITGGVVSSLGKGITGSSLGRLLKDRGLKVAMQKLDPYLNFDPGTMSPYQHGEVFVTDDGAEADLDLGHYERFTDENTKKYSNITTGKIYWSVINKERHGDYQGGTVQVIPHVTNEIKEQVYNMAKYNDVDVVITEIGGTVGDIESLPFLEAIRQIKKDVGRENCMYIHVTLVPFLSSAGEPKTKPTQHSVKELRSIGIQPDAIVCRTVKPLSKEVEDKIALFCDIDSEAVIQVLDVDSIYEVPLNLEEQGLDDIVVECLGLESEEPDLREWKEIVRRFQTATDEVNIALVGKYVELKDAYMSAAEALIHSGIFHKLNINIDWINSCDVTADNVTSLLKNADGIIVPGGFGDRGMEGKIEAIKYARVNKVPFLGICMGMQLAAVEFARNVLALEGANSTEIDKDTPHPIVKNLKVQRLCKNTGGTMRLGAYPCKVSKGTKAYDAYKEELISERHRNRYEINNEYRESLEEKGFKITGVYEEEDLVEMIEIEDHPWFIATQFHPEFKSRPNKAHPLFREFVGAAFKNKKK